MKNFKTTYIFRGLLFTFLATCLLTYIGMEIPWNNGFLKGLYTVGMGIAFFALLIYTLWDVDVRSEAEYEELLRGRFIPVKFPGKVTFLIVLVIIGHRCWLGGGEMKVIYNTSISYEKEYNQAHQEIYTTFDNLYNTGAAKIGIISLNRKDFFDITQMIFNARTDGKNVVWKWLQENQPVPYNEFTKFYSDLSAFVELKRNDILNLEKKKQELVKKHNVLIATFPNNLYNLLLNIKPMEYKTFDTPAEQIFLNK